MKAAKSADMGEDYWIMEFHWDIFNDLIEMQGYWGKNIFCKMCKKIATYNYKDFHGTLRCSKCRKTYSPMASTIMIIKSLNGMMNL